MTLIIAGERSGVGKTTVTLALLAFLSRFSNKVQAFKTGPDYIDPMFHSWVTGRPCRNLDPVLTSPEYVQSCFNLHSQDAEYSLVEGVMGLFDGIPFQPYPQEEKVRDFASTAHIARLLDIPVLLVLDCSRLSGSIGAIALGYCNFDPRVNIAGVILNKVGSERHLELLREALEPLHLPILGVLYRQPDIAIPDRHLGLVPTAELPQIEDIFQQLAQLAQDCFDWEQLLSLLEVRPTNLPNNSIFSPIQQKVRIAIARDRAFSFYYQDNLDLLERSGAELLPWSPLNDTTLPPDIQGLYFGGGFPEVFASELAANQPVKAAVKAAIASGIPTYAECGGLMYLCEQIRDFAGDIWDMVGVLPTQAVMEKRLTLGYRQGIPRQDNPFLKGEIVWGHEFHRSKLTHDSISPLYQMRSYRPNSATTSEGWQLNQLHASYLHLHWGEYPQIPQRFCNYTAQKNKIN